MSKLTDKQAVAVFISQYLIPTFGFYFTDGDIRMEFYKAVSEAESDYREVECSE